MLDDRAKRARTRMVDEVIASGSSLTTIFGVGPIIAATLVFVVVPMLTSETFSLESALAVAYPDGVHVFGEAKSAEKENE